MPVPRRLNLKLGAALLVLWLAGTTATVVLRWPPLAVKAALGLCAAAWAVHVARVVLADRRK
jgi:DMSO/TMAO reductase YedYZ heme-binding membrane subunit